ncbi:MarR family transcriptional regulator [Saccharothrix sp. S26]|uniref:MarR family winged helix-turn-helix transcriptional regulator n=1 Tax=Saccharothrix sp. S26 TaxID=2907215 RepID=UPI001F1C18E7|nr:MarR family transcriptional regulator [Saccharothrix sp. S26]MCE6995893.1 MarR family transcriptional regulator [Saccharothrix sp. S26]
MARTDGPGPELSGNLVYLLKHAHLRMAELLNEALAPHGVEGRELGVMLALAGRAPMSQQQAAQRLGIDRTTMVALLDALEGKGLVSRHPDAEDRRRNVVELTEAGRETLRLAVAASDEAERAFLTPLTPEAARELREALHAVVFPGRDEDA